MVRKEVKRSWIIGLIMIVFLLVLLELSFYKFQVILAPTIVCPANSGLGISQEVVYGSQVIGNDDEVYYCNPISLTYELARELGDGCIGDYECKSNLCLDNLCVSIKAQTNEQQRVLLGIWCALSNPVDFLARGEGYVEDNDYWECVGLNGI